MEKEMKKIFAIPLLAAVVLIVSACQLFNPVIPGAQTTETRTVSGFHAVLFTTAGELQITQGKTESLEITAGKNVLPHITTIVQNGVLEIGMDNSRWNNTISQPLVFKLSVINMDDISLSGAGNVQSGDLKSTDMKINLTGAGNIGITSLLADSLDATLSGAGNIQAAGSVPTQTILLTGLGNFQGDNLKTDETTVKLTGAGSATVWAEKTLDVTITGAGSVDYYGSPKVTENVSGLGSVRSAGTK
jgi:Putative auto-transporter adhesin, head GIN domain